MSTEAHPAAEESPESRVGVVGRPEVVAPFRAAGLAVFPVQPGPEAAARIEELAGSGLTVLFYTEDLYPYLAGVVGRCSRTATPCLVMLPMGAGQHGLTRLRELVKRAVGADVFGREPAERQAPRPTPQPRTYVDIEQELE
jgi:V/A-type H+/Na+-transporting ATPase subunit F